MERQQNEELLRVLSLLKTSEERYRIIAESVDEAICVIDLQMRFTFFNRRAEEITGYRRDELIGHSVLEIVGAEFRKRDSRRPGADNPRDRGPGLRDCPGTQGRQARAGGSPVPGRYPRQ